MVKGKRIHNALAVTLAVFALSGLASAGENGQSAAAQLNSGYPARESDAAAVGSGSADETYGVALTPAVYLVNFLLLYTSNPGNAAYMPAHMASIPAQVNDCLTTNPEGCPYADFSDLFGFNRSGDPNRRPIWPNACKEDPQYERLIPTIARTPGQLNEPLGAQRADKLAQILGIDPSMVLTDEEYQCTIGTPPRTQDQEIIYECIANLTNSRGNADPALSSFGLSVTSQGAVQSDCAPQAVCLVFNELFAGPLEKIAKQCHWAKKLERMVRATPFFQFVYHGNKCQQYAGAGTAACVVHPAGRATPAVP